MTGLTFNGDIYPNREYFQLMDKHTTVSDEEPTQCACGRPIHPWTVWKQPPAA